MSPSTATDDDPRVDELFTLAPQDFTAARNALVRQLRSDGRRELADAVAQLRRPTAAAWAVNKTVRGHPEAFAELLDAGDAVRAAQRRALSGVRRGGMREATRRRRDLIEQLADLAGAALDAHGVAAASHRADIVATFDAASADEDAAARVGTARLSQALPVSSDFDALDGLTMLVATDPAPADDESADDADDDAPTAADDEAAQATALARREAIRAVSDLRRRATEAQREADLAAAEAERAADRAAGADRAARTAEERARQLRRDADGLVERADRARARAAEAAADAGRVSDELTARQRDLEALD